MRCTDPASAAAPRPTIVKSVPRRATKPSPAKIRLISRTGRAYLPVRRPVRPEDDESPNDNQQDVEPAWQEPGAASPLAASDSVTQGWVGYCGPRQAMALRSDPGSQRGRSQGLADCSLQDPQRGA